MMTCPECGNKNLRTIDQELICNSCGLVIEDAPVEHHNPDAAPAMHPSIARAGTFHEGRIVKTGWLYTTRQKNLHRAKQEIQTLASKLHLPQIVATEAHLIMTAASNKGLTIGRDNISMQYASVYAACTLHNVPKTVLEITAYSPVTKLQLFRSYRVLCHGLNLRPKPIKPEDILHRFASRLNLSPKATTRAITIIESHHASGKRPETLVAAALYVAAKENGEERTQREVANTTGVIEITIRKQVKELRINSEIIQ